MEFKIVISNPKSRRSYQQEVKDERAKKFINLKIGSEFDGSIIGLAGYKLLVTGGSDKCGFPMRKGVHGTSRPKLLLGRGIGYKPKRDVRKRKRVRGDVISEDIVQINTKVIGYGKKNIEELLGSEKSEGKPVETIDEKPKKAEEKPAKKPEKKFEQKKEVKSEEKSAKEPSEEKPKEVEKAKLEKEEKSAGKKEETPSKPEKEKEIKK